MQLRFILDSCHGRKKPEQERLPCFKIALRDSRKKNRGINRGETQGDCPRSPPGFLSLGFLGLLRAALLRITAFVPDVPHSIFLVGPDRGVWRSPNMLLSAAAFFSDCQPLNNS